METYQTESSVGSRLYIMGWISARPVRRPRGHLACGGSLNKNKERAQGSQRDKIHSYKSGDKSAIYNATYKILWILGLEAPSTKTNDVPRRMTLCRSQTRACPLHCA